MVILNTFLYTCMYAFYIHNTQYVKLYIMQYSKYLLQIYNNQIQKIYIDMT